ncbi:PLC-like phosphodiesterase, TIM beta/alpha-barrel-containing protein domain containing protein [Nitzschia inconspicua]|uniref:PLC-like phosphodiesterase, TIM beta/alpha-barrel-containing protein domain containing protein n=1 Tax=Nitzschia inconspicua TaxID=303405 RepID=A0A9K3M5H0_9STRA|nr:PLC-like phosphodiesterase, TIM beta/alpha-barrel-containing protein domain containing protein [Nitzschia inconspicua]
MRLFGGKENDALALDTTPRRSSTTRKFGTPLHSNLQKTPDSKHKYQQDGSVSGSLKKVVRVRRTPQSTLATESVIHPSNEKSVVFVPGPVGMQLEPVNEDPVYGCRVVRFVDGGPKNPGQARRSGKIQPGDWVLKVEAEGTLEAATTYEEILNLLKHTHVKRILTIKSVWDESIMGITERGDHSKRTTTLGFIPTRKPMSSKPTISQSSRFTPAKLLANHAPPHIPPSVPEDEVLLSPARSNSINNELVKSPSDMVLLSKSMDDLSRISSSSSRQKSTTDGPVIIPINDFALVDDQGSTLGCSDEDSNSNEADSITRSRSPMSEQTTKSSNKSHLIELAPQPLADQFLFFDGYTGALVPESPYVSSSSKSLETTTASGYEESTIIDEDDLDPATPRQELSYSPTKGDRITDSVKSQLQNQQEMLDRSLLRADFEQRLQAARMEYSKTERELKELYVQTCERNELKIRELQSSKSALRKKVDGLQNANLKLHDEAVSRTMELDMSKTMVKELERKIVALESEKGDTVLRFNEACDSIQELEHSVGEKIQLISVRDAEIKSLQRQVANLKAELHEEKEGRVAAASKIMKLEEQLLGLTAQELSVKKQFGMTQSMLEKSDIKNRELTDKLKVFEKEQAEVFSLAKQLSLSVHEKQNDLVTVRSIVSCLQSENESLTEEITSTNMDVQNLLEEKQTLEKKLAETSKDFHQAKEETSSIHATLMEKIETGEFFTAADVEEKQDQVDALQNELKQIKVSSLVELTRQNKQMVNLQIKVRCLEQHLHDERGSKDIVCMERDEYCRAMHIVKDFVQLSKEKIRQAQIDFAMVQKENAELKSQVENIQTKEINSSVALSKRVKSLVQEVEEQRSTILDLSKAKERNEQEHLRKQTKLQQELTSTIDELTTTKKKVAGVSDRCDDIAGSEKRLLKKMEEVRSTKDAIEKKYQKAKSDLESLRTKASSADRALSIFAQKLSKSKDEEDSIRAKYERAVSEKSILERDFRSKMQAMEDELKAPRESAKESEMKLQSTLVASERDFRLKIQAMEDELKVLRESAKESEMKLQSTRIASEKDVAELSHEIELARKELERKDENLSSASVLVRQLEKELITQQVKHAPLEEQVKQLKHDMEHSEKVHKQQTEVFEATLKWKEDELKKIKENFENLNEEIGLMKTEFEAKAKSLALLNEQRIDNYTKNIEDLRKETEVKVDNFESKQKDWVKIERQLLTQIESLKLDNEQVWNVHREGVAYLTEALATARKDVADLKAKLREHDDAVLESNQLREKLRLATIETEKSSRSYWEDLQDFTAELQSKDELLSCAESRMNDLEEEISLRTRSLKDLKAENVNLADRIIELQSEVASHKKMIDFSEAQCTKLDMINANLGAKITKLEGDLSERNVAVLTLQQCLDNLGNEKEKTESHLSNALREATERSNILSRENEFLLVDLEKKTKQLEIEITKASDLREETASLTSLVEKLQEDIRLSTICLEKERSEKELAMANAADAKMEMNLQIKKSGSQAAEKERALCKSENIRSKLARHLLQANAVIASLQVQLENAKTVSTLLEAHDHRVRRLEVLYHDASAEAERSHGRILFLQECLRLREVEVLAQTQKLNSAATEITNLREQYMQKDRELSFLSDDLEASRNEILRLTDMVAEAKSLRDEVEEKSNRIVYLEKRLSKAECCAESAFDSLELAHQSTHGLREKFSGLSSCLRKEVIRLKSSHGSPRMLKTRDSSGSPGENNTCNEDGKSTLEFELSSISHEMDSLSALIDERNSDVDALHETVNDLAEKLADNEVTSKSLKREKEILQNCVSAHEMQLLALKTDHQHQVLALQKLVLATRASCVAIHLRKRRIQKIVTVEKTDLLKNIESLSARLISMQEYQRRNTNDKENFVLSLQKTILKLRADHIVLYLESKTQREEARILESERESAVAQVTGSKNRISSLELELDSMRKEVEKIVLAGKSVGELLCQIETLSSHLQQLQEGIKDRDLKIATSASYIEQLKQLRDSLIEQNQKLQLDMAEKCSTEENMKKEMGYLSVELRSAKDANEGLTADLLETKAANVTLRDVVKSLRATVSAAEAAVTDSGRRINILEHKLRSESQNNQTLKHNLQAKAESVNTLYWRLEQLCAKAEHVEMEKLTIEESRSIDQLHLVELRRSVAKLHQEKNAARQIAARERFEISSTLQERDAQILSLRSEIQAKDQTISDLKEKIIFLEEEQKGVIVALSKFSGALESERSKTKALHDRNIDQEKRLHEMHTMCVESETELEKTKCNYAGVEASKLQLESEYLNRIGRLELELKVSEERLQGAETRASALALETNQLMDKNRSLCAKITFLEAYRSENKELKEEVERRVIEAKQQERQIVDLEELLEKLRCECDERVEEIAEKILEVDTLKKEIADRDSRLARLREPSDLLAQTVDHLQVQKGLLERNNDWGMSEEMVSHVKALKEAFRKQIEVLDDLKLSENVLSNFMNEVMRLACKTESEALELSSTLNSVEDLLIRPSSCLASLDLAGIGAANEYIDEVRTRLEDMAALAYNTSVELKVRQSEFHQWKSSRQAPPPIPITPPPKPIKRILFSTTLSSMSSDRIHSKLAGARLMSCVMENRSKMELASAFRKWSCCAGAIRTCCSHKETTLALARQLDQTREKLLILKSHLKGKQQKPRLRRILDRLDSNNYRDKHQLDDVSFEI